MVRRLNRYCFARMQVKMAWNWENIFNILRFHQEGFLQTRNLTAYALQWKAKTHARLYYAGDVTERTWRKTWQDRGSFKRESAMHEAIRRGDVGKMLVGFSTQKTGIIYEIINYVFIYLCMYV